MDKFIEVLPFILGFGLLIGIPLYFKQKFLAGTFGIFLVCFGIMEWWAVAATDKTISQQFWALSRENPAAAWTILGIMLAFWLFLLGHFAYKHLLKRKDK